MAEQKIIMMAELRLEESKLVLEPEPVLSNAEGRTSISSSRLRKTLFSAFSKPSGASNQGRIPVPELSQARRQESLSDRAFESANDVATGSGQQKTVLYLAYGSNLCYQTFQGQRGIKPIAQINVVVPELRMTFDLPGIPYSEPCFANSARRSTIPSDVESRENIRGEGYHKDRWKKGMVGVVYEVTLSDYAHIIATEGGGSSYHDIMVTCFPLSSDGPVPEFPTTEPFRSHTLFAPAVKPPKAGQPAPPFGTRFQRPDPSYAQPSARYMNLLKDGADEHNIPQEYKDYLHGIRPYEITTQAQRMGQFVFISFWYPFILLIFALNRVYQDENGKAPKWLTMLSNAIFTSVWTSYDNVFKPIFGDGERCSHGKDGLEEGKHGVARRWRTSRCDEEWISTEKDRM